LSNFVKDLAAEELRVRHGNAYAVGQTFLGTVANPLVFAFGINTGGTVNLVVTKCIFTASLATSVTWFQSGTNPGLATGNTPFSRFPGSAQPNNAQFQCAVAPAPTVGSALATAQLAPGVPVNLCAGDVFIITVNQWFIWEIPALAVTVSLALSWYNLIN